MQMTSKLEETKRKAAIINKTKRRLGGPEQEFKAGDGELRRGPGGGRKLGTPRKKPNPRCVFRLPANLPSSPRDEIKTGPQKVAARERRGRGGGEDHLTTSRSLTLQPRAGYGERSIGLGAYQSRPLYLPGNYNYSANKVIENLPPGKRSTGLITLISVLPGIPCLSPASHTPTHTAPRPDHLNSEFKK